MKHWFSLFVLVVGLSEVAGQESPANEYCPVTPSDRAEADIYTDYEGERIYFCCKSCLRDFLKDPEAYLENLNVAAINAGPSEPTSGKLGENVHAQAIEETAHGAEELGHDENHEHDHSDHGSKASSVLVLFGKLHVIVVHFPIALIPFAGMAETLFLFRRTKRWAEIAKVSFVAGTLAACLAAIMGWIAADLSSYPDSLQQTLFSHRWLGVSTAILAFAGSMFLYAFPGFEKSKRWAEPAIILTLSAITLATAHFGGSLIYGPNYLF